MASPDGAPVLEVTVKQASAPATKLCAPLTMSTGNSASLLAGVTGATTVTERHRHRYEVNNHYLPRLEATGLVVSARAKSPTAGDLCEMIELADHPWFFGCQFHPEFTSNPRRGHPLFVSFVRAALEQQRTAGAPAAAVAELVASI